MEKKKEEKNVAAWLVGGGAEWDWLGICKFGGSAGNWH